MAWRWGWRGGGRGGWWGPWPGRGPFSHLPPWMRPGWLYGRGACRWLLGPWTLYYINPLPYYAPHPYRVAPYLWSAPLWLPPRFYWW